MKANPGHVFGICGQIFDKANVRVEDFWDVAGDSKAYRNNSLDGSYSLSPPENILERAMAKIGEIGYNIIWKNCEHFEKFCRYGKEKSEQVEGVVWSLVAYWVGGFILLRMFLYKK
ncbi:phospholipase A and acyltransferase 1-like [Dreissena polymorpha]|uniref:LRAT domain-containing protein n=1 Tax=Dreissena polymorpha TaxID=45954 RepID=A0A9D4M038_DREPO|nr:phospholipase A and acyltransferase 1-like [Dreissena polymorpha]KAH3868355.1 hypothetical protein DPMN_031499 [Dreissena polymorpha]